jgi:restriction endonuclease Mrr
MISEYIKTLFDEFYKDSIIYDFAYNFIEKYDDPEGFKSILLDRYRILSFEFRLRKQFSESYGREYLLTKDDLKDPMYAAGYGTQSFFSNFVKLIGLINVTLKLPLEDEEIAFIVWAFLRKVAIDYYSKKYMTLVKDYSDSNSILTTLDEHILEFKKIIKDYQHLMYTHAFGRFVYFLMKNNYLNDDNNKDFPFCSDIVTTRSNEITSLHERDNFINELMAKSLDLPIELSYSIDDIDVMNGHEFEEFLVILFKALGYNSEKTRGSGDQGVDLLAKKNNRTFGIQAKCYSGKVTNKAIQEIVAGLAHYKLQTGIVVTNNYFTDSAVNLAMSNQIILWDRTMLKEKLKEAFSKNM